MYNRELFCHFLPEYNSYVQTTLDMLSANTFHQTRSKIVLVGLELRDTVLFVNVFELDVYFYLAE